MASNRMEQTSSTAYLCEEYLKNNFINPETCEHLGVKRGLRNPNGTGVLAGLTNVCDVVGYEMVDGNPVPAPGKLIYRGIDVTNIVQAAYKEDRFIFEEVIWLLLFGALPTAEASSQGLAVTLALLPGAAGVFCGGHDHARRPVPKYHEQNGAQRAGAVFVRR